MFADIFGKGFENRVAMYIPSTRSVDEALSGDEAEQFVDRALRFLSELFGGATALSARGAWITESGSMVVENTTVVYAFASKLSRDELIALKQFALALKAELGQESVAVEINGTLFLA